MPIKITKLNKDSLDEDEKAVYDFLDKNSGNGYTELEIIGELNEYIFRKFNNPQSSLEKQKALEEFKLLAKLGKLMSLNLVLKRVDKGKEYFYVDR